MKKLFINILFLLFCSFSFSSQTNLEEIPIDLKVNNLEAEKTIIGYFDLNTLEPFVNLDEFFKTISINAFTYNKDVLEYQLNGETRKVKVLLISYEDKNLISSKELKKIFKKTKIEWDISSMELSIGTEDQLPWEFEKKQQILHGKIDRKKNEKQNLYVGKMHIFTPGILGIHYSKNNIDDSRGNYLSLMTTNQILYGNFEQSTSITDNKITLDNVLWSRELYENRKISIGDQYSDLPFYMKPDSSYMGLKIYNENSWGGSGLDVKKHSIEGYAQDGLMIELYKNGILKDYQISKSSKFNFIVPSTDGINKYEIWIYEKDGTVKKQKISLYNDQKVLEKNTFDYGIELGKGEKNKNFNPYNLNLRYGLTNHISLGIETYNVDGEAVKIKNKKFNNYSLVYQDLFFKNLTNRFEANYSTNIEDVSENMYRLELNSDVKFFDNTLGIKNYEKLDERLKVGNYDTNIYDRGTFSIYSVRTVLGYEQSTSKNEVRDTYQLNLAKDFFSNFIMTNLNYSKDYYSRRSSNQNLEIRLSHDLRNRSFKKYINTLILGYKTNLSNNSYDNYEVMFGKNKIENSNFQYYASVDMSQRENRIGLTFNYTFGKKLFATSSSHWSSNDKTKVLTSIGANATVDFESPDLLVDPNQSGDSSINGVAYIDANNNGVYDPKDEVVEGLTIGSASQKVSSKENGKFFIPNLSSLSIQKLELKIENDEYLGGYVTEKYISYETFPGESLNINIPIKEVKTIIGDVKFTDDFYLEDVQKFIKNSKIYITNIQTGGPITIALKDEYFIYELPQGEYSIEIKNNLVKNEFSKKQNRIFYVKSNKDTEKYITLFISKGQDGKEFNVRMESE